MAKKFFDLPATVGVQGGVRQFLVTIPLRVLKHILTCDDHGSTMQRSQRDVNHKRRTKIADYVNESIRAKKPYILPTLSGNLEKEVEFTPFDGRTDAGLLRLYKGDDIKLFDGQHRSASVDFFHNLDKLPDTISVLFTENIDLETRQQFFSDINFNAVKPSAAQNKAYDKRDPRNMLAQYVAENSGLNRCGCIEYEKNSVTGSNQALFSFKALYDCLVKMFRLTDKSEVTAQMMEDGSALISAWSSKMYWCILPGSRAPSYRQSYLGTHGIMVLAIGAATRYLLDTRTVAEAIEVIKESEIHYQNNFGFVDFEKRCVDQDTWKIKCDSRALKLTTSLLLQHLEVVLPDELKELETEVFGTTSFLTSEDAKAYEFVADTVVQSPATVKEWKELITEKLEPFFEALSMSISGCLWLATTMYDLERKIPFTRTREELLQNWVDMGEIDVVELQFLRDHRRLESNVKWFMNGKEDEPAENTPASEEVSA
ncbi:TPA: DGQHR domain-containing protein [Klebsiella aerogenes]